MRKIFLLTIVFSFVSIFGCKDYLDETPITNASIDFLYNTPEGLEAAVVGLYDLNRRMYNIGPNENSKTLYLMALSDIVIARAGFISVIAKFDKTWISPTGYGSVFLRIIWQANYKVIDRANAVIAAAEKLEGIDEDRRNHIIAEAKAFRANSLFILWRMFNNVFVKTEPTTPENVFDRVEKPSTKAEIFTLLNSDLDAGIEYLDWKTEPGRMTKAVCHHLKAKVALWSEEWQVAADNADAIINSGFYKLMDSPSQVFAGDRNHDESLFVIQLNESAAGGGRPHFIGMNFQVSYHRVEGAKFSPDQGGRGFSFMYPNDYLLGLYEPSDERLNTYYRLKYYYNDADNLPAGVSLGDEIVIPKTGSTQSKYYERIHPACMKYYDDEIPADAALSYKNVIVYRLAETHLIAAEAYMKLNMQSKAVNRIQPLQLRAGIEPIFSVSEIALLKEHARELAFEGHRWYYLKRTGKLMYQVTHFSGDDDYKNDARGNIREYMINFPIPQTELDLLGPDYPQNDGYN